MYHAVVAQKKQLIEKRVSKKLIFKRKKTVESLNRFWLYFRGLYSFIQMAIPNSMHGREFIEAMYVCLWNSSDYRYKNKKLRNRAYDDLFVIYKQIDPEATIDGMKKKLIIFALVTKGS